MEERRKKEEGRRNRGSIQILGGAPKGRMKSLETRL